MRLLSIAENVLAKIEAGIIAFFVSTMVLLAFLQVVLRNVFSFGFLWADPLLRYMVVWVGFLGAVLATKEEKHLGIDFLNRFLPGRILHLVKAIVEGFAGVVAYLLTRAAFEFLFEGITATETDVFDLSKRFYFGVIPVGFGLITLHFAIRIVRHSNSFFAGQRKQDPPAENPPA